MISTVFHIRSNRRLLVVALGVLIALCSITCSPGRASGANALTNEDALEIAIESYTYAYPLVLIEMTRQLATNVEMPDKTGILSPMNQFAHKPDFPDASFTQVVRPNADTLYSTIFFDVTKEPIVIHVPDSNGRYYLLPMLDMWSDVFASPGSRTTGTGEQTFAIVGPAWNGELPDGMDMFRSPTGVGWMIGRIQTNGKSDYKNVHKFQAGLKAYPLSAWGKEYVAPKGTVDPKISSQPPVEQVAGMNAANYFALFTKLTGENPPHANDYPILARMKRIGIEPGKPFELAKTTPQVQEALKKVGPIVQKKIKAGLAGAGTIVNNWSMLLSPIGTYGTDYERRMLVAFGGLGANTIEDAIYPTAFLDAEGKPFASDKKYILQFKKEEIPPARAFWSLTMYNEKQLFADNPINRYAIGDRDKLTFNKDGSLSLYIQRQSPGKDKESNWLPTPKTGGFSMNLRLYWPERSALDGTWKPPVVKQVK